MQMAAREMEPFSFWEPELKPDILKSMIWKPYCQLSILNLIQSLSRKGHWDGNCFEVGVKLPVLKLSDDSIASTETCKCHKRINTKITENVHMEAEWSSKSPSAINDCLVVKAIKWISSVIILHKSLGNTF